MPNFEYDYTDKDYQLIATEEQRTLGTQDYVRISVYDENSNNLITLPNDRSIKAIFYSSLSEAPFRINQTQFSQKIPENEELDIRLVGGDEKCNQ